LAAGGCRLRSDEMLTLPNRIVTEAEPPLRTSLFDELVGGHLVLAFNPERLVDEAVPRLPAANVGGVTEKGQCRAREGTL
jgi:hypothetical protein